MELVAARGDRLAHTDHQPKHGGQFFMALDKQHHLEGTLVTPGQLRIYLYDEFTLPLDPQGYAGEATVQPTSARGVPSGDGVKVALLPDGPRSALVARLPASLRLPCDVEVWLRFPRAAEPELFNFHFAELRDAD